MGKDKQETGKAKPDKLAALVKALPVLEQEFKLRPVGKAGLCLRAHSGDKKDKTPPLTAMDMEARADEVLKFGVVAANTSYKAVEDSYKFLWLILQSDDFANLVFVTSKVAASLREKGHADNLVVGMFPFLKDDKDVFWVYSFGRDRFYPFVPGDEEPRRNNQLEVDMAEKLEKDKDFPLEQHLELWRALWGAPFNIV